LKFEIKSPSVFYEVPFQGQQTWHNIPLLLADKGVFLLAAISKIPLGCSPNVHNVMARGNHAYLAGVRHRWAVEETRPPLEIN
jgi:hypothetical protein